MNEVKLRGHSDPDGRWAGWELDLTLHAMLSDGDNLSR